MPSIIPAYVAGSGFVPLTRLGQTMWSGLPQVPIGELKIYNDIASSGSIYVSFSGVTQSGIPLLVASGGATVNSGGWSPLSGGAQSGFGQTDGYKVPPNGTYNIPKLALPYSGYLNVSIGTDLACSGGNCRVYFEAF